MKIKRFTAPTTRAALELVKQEQGADAVILSSTATDDGVEVVAATDYDEALLHQTGLAKHAEAERALASAPQQNFSATQDSRSEHAADIEYHSLRQEFGSLRELVQTQISQMSWLSLSHDRPEQAALIRSLSGIGLTGDVVASLAQELEKISDPNNAWRHAIAQFARKIPLTLDDPVAKGGRFALLGSTGAGKTATVAKLATRFVVENGARDLGLISFEAQAMSAPEQLVRVGQVLGVPVQQVRGPIDLRDTLCQLDSKKLVLIDTPGRSLRNSNFDRAIAPLADPALGIRRIVVLPGNSQTGFHRETIQRYKPMEPESVTITKLDETTSLGGLLSLLITHQLPISYLTDGQEFASGLQSAHRSRAALASKAVELAKRFREKAPRAAAPATNPVSDSRLLAVKA